MTHRERVLTTLAHRVPDRVPRRLSLLGAANDQFKARTGATDPEKPGDRNRRARLALTLPFWKGYDNERYDKSDLPSSDSFGHRRRVENVRKGRQAGLGNNHSHIQRHSDIGDRGPTNLVGNPDVHTCRQPGYLHPCLYRD